MATTLTTPLSSSIAGVAWFSTRPEALANFYEHVLTISFEQRDHADGRRHWICMIGGMHLEIKAKATVAGTTTSDWAQPVGSETSNSPLSSCETTFFVDDAAVVFQRALDLGGTSLDRPTEKYGGTLAVIADPDGNRIGFFSTPDNPPSQPIAGAAH